MEAILVLAVGGVLVTSALLVLVFRGRQRLEKARLLAEDRERRYRSLFESSMAGIALIDARGELVEWNDRLPTLLGADIAPAGSGPLRQDAWQATASTMARLVRSYAPGTQHETSFIAADGNRRWVALRHWPMADCDSLRRHPDASDDRGGRYWLLVSDVTRRQAERTQLRLARKAYQSISEAILVTDVTTRISDVNPAFERITGYARDEAIGMPASILRSGRQDAEFYAGMWQQLATGGHWSGEIWNRCKDGRIIPCWMHIDAVGDPENTDVTHYVGVFSDITERKVIEERICFLAHHDPLTGLANRFSLEAVLPQSIALARRNGWRVALLFIDLDRFKEINDTHGHAVGDQVLREASRRLDKVLRESDFLARIGGDEFVIVLNEADGADDALRVATAIIAEFRPPIEVGEMAINITTSIGISLFPDDGENGDTLLHHADGAMYRVKDAGRNGFHFHSPSLS